MEQPFTSPFDPAQNDVGSAFAPSQATVDPAPAPQVHPSLLSEAVHHIQAKAEELKYRPQRFARVWRKGRSRTLGIVFRSNSRLTHQERITALAQSAMEHGYEAIALDEEWFIHRRKKRTQTVPQEPSATTGDTPEEHPAPEEPASPEDVATADAPPEDEAAALKMVPPSQAVIDYLLDAAVEGVILCGLTSPEMKGWAETLRLHSLPYLYLSNIAPTTSSRESSVEADLGPAFEAMTRHHLSLGSRHLVFLLDYYASRQKAPRRQMRNLVDGFIRAIREAGGQAYTEPKHGPYFEIPTRIPKRTAPPIVGEILYVEKSDAFSNRFELGQYEMTRLIQSGNMPDSLICSSDEIALGALGACIRHGISVPKTIRISGGGDAPFGRYCGIPLSTIRQPTAQMAQRSIVRLIELIEAQLKGKASYAAAEVTQPVRLPCEIVIRASTEATPDEPFIEQTEDDLADIY